MIKRTTGGTGPEVPLESKSGDVRRALKQVVRPGEYGDSHKSDSRYLAKVIKASPTRPARLHIQGKYGKDRNAFLFLSQSLCETKKQHICPLNKHSVGSELCLNNCMVHGNVGVLRKNPHKEGTRCVCTQSRILRLTKVAADWFCYQILFDGSSGLQ